MKGVPTGEAVDARTPAAELLTVMDRRNLRTLVNLTGGVGSGLAESIRTYQQPHPDRFVVFTEPSYERIAEPGYPAWQADELARAKRAGARGLKVLKTLGLFLRERVTPGPLVKVDDPRFDPMWEACGALGLPVAIHVSDPTAFFLPIDAYNERYEELNRHPDWSFHGKDYPSNAEILAARDRVFARHPRTTFIGLHVGHSRRTSRRVGGPRPLPQPARRDRGPHRRARPPAARVAPVLRSLPGPDPLRHRWSPGCAVPDLLPVPGDGGRVLRLRPGPVPPQGRWRIYGLGLRDQILKKVYAENAERLLSL